MENMIQLLTRKRGKVMIIDKIQKITLTMKEASEYLGISY